MTSLAVRLIVAVAEPPPGIDALTVTLSLGIAHFTGRVVTADAVLHEADTAMYQAKNRGRNQHATYQPHPGARPHPHPH